MILREYVFELKDRLLLPHGDPDTGAISDHTDDFHTNKMLIKNVHDALRKVCTDARLFETREKIALVEDVYEYSNPINCLKIHSLIHTYSNDQTVLHPVQSRTAFEDSFNPTTNRAAQPTEWTGADKKAEVHRFWDSDESDYVTASTVTTGDDTYLYDENANFGVIESGEKLEPDDNVWDDTDDGYGIIDYLEMNTAVITGSGTVSGGSATTLTTADDLSDAKMGHLIWDTTANIWGIITAINTSTGIITVHEWNAQGSETIPSNGDDYKVGIANKIYFKALNPFTTRGVRGGADDTFVADDVYRVQDKYHTVPTYMIKPVPNATDTTGTESLTIIFSSEPQRMLEDDDPCCVEDQWSSYILDYAWYLALKRQPDRLGEAEALEAAYDMKIARMKEEQAIMEYGDADNIFDHIDGGVASKTSFYAKFSVTV